MGKPTFEEWLAHVEVSGKRLTEWQLAWAREVLVEGRMPVVFRGRRTLPPIDSTIRLTPAFAMEYPDSPDEVPWLEKK